MIAVLKNWVMKTNWTMALISWPRVPYLIHCTRDKLLIERMVLITIVIIVMAMLNFAALFLFPDKISQASSTVVKSKSDGLGFSTYSVNILHRSLSIRLFYGFGNVPSSFIF